MLERNFLNEPTNRLYKALLSSSNPFIAVLFIEASRDFQATKCTLGKSDFETDIR